MAEKKPAERAQRKSQDPTAHYYGNWKQNSTKKATASTASVAKMAKKSPVAVIFAILFLVVGAVGGYFGVQLFTKNDTFAMVGEDYIEVEMNSVYVDQGCKAVLFGKNVSDTVTVTYFYREDISHVQEKVIKVDTSIDGFYYVQYNCNTFLYSNINLIRTIEIVRVEDNG